MCAIFAASICSQISYGFTLKYEKFVQLIVVIWLVTDFSHKLFGQSQCRTET
jgi:hypothetical protein